MERVVLVKSYFEVKYEKVAVKVPTGEKKKGLFGISYNVHEEQIKEKPIEVSDRLVDVRRLAFDLQNAISELNDEGYSVKTITPIISGDYSYSFRAEGISSTQRANRQSEKVRGGISYGYGYGFSFTDGLLIVAEKIT